MMAFRIVAHCATTAFIVAVKPVLRLASVGARARAEPTCGMYHETARAPVSGVSLYPNLPNWAIL